MKAVDPSTARIGQRLEVFEQCQCINVGPGRLRDLSTQRTNKTFTHEPLDYRIIARARLLMIRRLSFRVE